MSPSPSSRKSIACYTALSLLLGPWASMPTQAAAATSAPQVLLTITNSQSMDGTTSGAIMVGSGKLSAVGDSSLLNSASPANYTIPPGFTPPLNAGSGGQAPYTVSCGSSLCDNGPSRLNLAKSAIQQVLANYGDALNFGLYTYQTGTPTLYTTWVYQMSPNGGPFTFTNTYVDEASTPANPCYAYDVASATVKSNCTAMAAIYGTNFKTSPYMNMSLSSDSPTVNDVLYAGSSYPSVFVDYNGVSPATPFPPNFALSNYNNGGVTITYGKVLPTNGIRQTGPTNAGYVPYSPQVMYVKRGFGYGASQNATTGKTAVAMTGDVSNFANALAPETNNASSAEVKAVAGQSAIGGLLKGALSYLNGLSKAACQKQYVVLLTDGLPTLDLNGKAWPPLGSLSGNSYGVTATFKADGSLDTTNNQALTDAINSIKNLASAGINTYVIGLGAGVNTASNPMAAQTLQAMAVAGGTTTFYPASDAPALNTAFLKIAEQIFQASSVSAPVAPLTVQSGNALLYTLTSNPQAQQQAGTVKAFAVGADGTPSATQSWEAGALMSKAQRLLALRSTATNGDVVPLSSIDAAAYQLSPTSCVPDVDTILNYTAEPSYTGGPCSYIGNRLPGSFLGTFSTQNTGTFVPPPGSSTLLGLSGYANFVSTQSRPSMLLFTNNDGFLYAVDASAGTLLWAWTPRSVLARMQNYSTFTATTQMDGNFTVVDAPDGGNWASYVVGSLGSGAEHFSLRLNATGMPSKVVFGQTVAGGTAPGDKSAATGASPLRQIPQIVEIKGSLYYIYIVNLGGTSTLYEVNVATGASTSKPLGMNVSSSLYVDPQNKQLWMGSSSGDIWTTTLTGNALSDALNTVKAASTLNPSNSGALVAPILYVGYTEYKGIPYMYAANASMLTMFGVSQTGWTPIWASTPSAGYRYSSGLFASSADISTLTPGGVVSDMIRVDGNIMTVPMFAPPADSCGAGKGYYDFFDLSTGKFPSIGITYAGNIISTRILIGAGPAFTPSWTLTDKGLGLYTKTKGDPGAPTPPIDTKIQNNATPIGWRH
ncbi:type IV pilus assembly protein PilY1 [Paucibacter oligotrophus]|uniref:Type IV pilus assembly protein PilY1 n=1 Tax=Roseateles oligotrophus TaxID=1769250 RepID=A0A840LDN6_9BURK|nr:hypothetical protein [Roseateles oligotrophus]MBB4844773.1 type IV pilus assembly protein PilY1 [Roseateles oligotrophus]